MTEMVERVAKTLQEIDFTVGHPNYYQVAKAVIEAMREPTQGMMAAVDCAGEKADWLSGRAWKAGWQAMIDAALQL